jgi:hypothetical protein
MEKNITILRDITRIEEELTAQYAGVLVFLTNQERLIQMPCTFLYYHKNVYAAMQPDDDLLEKIVYDTNVSFTVLKSEKVNKHKSQNQKTYYKVISVTLNGILKRPEDFKINDEIRELYSLKYSGSKLNEEETLPVHFLMLDTVEIKAFEEAGG